MELRGPVLSGWYDEQCVKLSILGSRASIDIGLYSLDMNATSVCLDHSQVNGSSFSPLPTYPNATANASLAILDV
jgi:hypothetical protein